MSLTHLRRVIRPLRTPKHQFTPHASPNTLYNTSESIFRCSKRTVEHCSTKFESLDGTWLQVNRPLRDFDQHAVRTICPARS
ncbi:Uncharacterized protein DBV15_07258 [Temnothorax longispinosus]|uniref:Uncharacterized protein n=1 Tax=Temnothorax longispinosus TaxID=300112 RepID=A0A4S2JNK0_9HYME|nr:Uncharacterized protein DBV15_07258 [Temnothorax longispinosus]